MLVTSASTEPRRVSGYFDQRGWPSEVRSHAEVSQTFQPNYGWRIKTGRTKISQDWLLVAQAEGITQVTLRERFADRRTVTADFSVAELLA